MSKPPATPPSSDIAGVNRDARAGKPSGAPHPDPGGSLAAADEESKAQPDLGRPSGGDD